MLKMGIAGLGFAGQIHLRNFLQHPEVEVVALADLDPDRRKGLIPGINLDSLRIRSYENCLDMCQAEGLGAVALNLPSDLHAEPALAALKSGKHVFCEKPIDLSLEKGLRMIQTAKESGTTLMIGHTLRFWPEYRTARELVMSGEYGRAIAASFVRCRELPRWAFNSWFNDPKRSGGVGIDLHIHDADYCVSLWGKPCQIAANGCCQNGRTVALYAWWNYAEGPVVQFESTWEPAAKTPFYFGFRITLEKATLLYDSRNQRGLCLATDQGLERLTCDPRDAYRIQDDYFIDCILKNKPVTECPPEESLTSLECVLKESEFLRNRFSAHPDNTTGI